MSSAPVITAVGLVKRFGAFRALDGLDLLARMRGTTLLLVIG